MQFLNLENMARSTAEVEFHPLKPFLPKNAKVLFLGSFPPQRKRWSMDFFYPNFINDHWRIEGQIFFGDRNHFVDEREKRFRQEEIVAFCQEKGIAFFDTATAIRRTKDNASDKFLEVVEATDVAALLAQMPQCQALVTTGQKATDVIVDRFGCQAPAVGECVPLCVPMRELTFWRMPSTSRAYPLSLEKKAEAYAKVLEQNEVQSPGLFQLEIK